MRRFLIGLVLGGSSSAITYASGASPLWVAGIGVGVGLVC